VQNIIYWFWVEITSKRFCWVSFCGCVLYVASKK